MCEILSDGGGITTTEKKIRIKKTLVNINENKSQLVVPIKKELENNVLFFSNQIDHLIQNNLITKKKILSNLIKFLKAPNYILKFYKEKIQSLFDNFSREVSDIIEKKTSKIDNFSRIIKLPKSYQSY